ncbi:MAG: hypothetical protein Q4C70_15730, partial [Planctomycetia bacterium]|nr:hypothetical protein [Planctomycetia bacterium]
MNMPNIPSQPENPWPHPLPKPIERLLTETARTVQRNEIRRTLWMLATGTAMFFMLIVLAEHWIFPRGLSAIFRFFLLTLLLGTWATLFYRNILPFYRWKLHPYYLAHLIETARPDLKNSLLNLLYILRKSEMDEETETTPDSVIDNSIPENPVSAPVLERRVIRLLERQTTKQAATLEVSTLFPMDPARRWKIAAVAFLALFLTYAILTPKSTFRTVARTLLPWYEIDAPTRVRIVSITATPANLRIHQGETFTVTAEIRRLPSHAQPTLFYTSADRKHVRVPIPMTRVSGEK